MTCKKRVVPEKCLLLSMCVLTALVGLVPRPALASSKQVWQAVSAPLVAGNGGKRVWLGLRNTGPEPKVICDRFVASFGATLPDGGTVGGTTTDSGPCDPMSQAIRLEPGQALVRPVRLPEGLPGGRVNVIITAWELTDFPFSIAREISISGEVGTGR